MVVVEDEADQSEHGRDEYSGDTGVSNRLRQMRFEFVGDPAIQGKVLWIRITNRPDRLDKADLRSGRSSERIPFFMPDFAEKCHIFQVVARRSHIPCDFPDFAEVTRYLEQRHPEVITGGDIEELVFRAYRQARLAGREQVQPRRLSPGDRRLPAAPPDGGPAPHGAPGPEPVLLPALRAGRGSGPGPPGGGGGRII